MKALSTGGFLWIVLRALGLLTYRLWLFSELLSFRIITLTRSLSVCHWQFDRKSEKWTSVNFGYWA